MAKQDWKALQQQFLSEHNKSGITPKEWCEERGLNYATAKRHIKIANGSAQIAKEIANEPQVKEKQKTGRPSDYMREVAADICAKLAEGESLRKVCERPGMPSKTSVFRWLAEHQEFRDQYAKAAETRADAIFESMFDIADSAPEEAAAVAKARLRIDTRKWALARMNPKKYGDKVSQDIDIKSSDGSMSPQPTTVMLVAAGEDDDSSENRTASEAR